MDEERTAFRWTIESDRFKRCPTCGDKNIKNQTDYRTAAPAGNNTHNRSVTFACGHVFVGGAIDLGLIKKRQSK